VAAEYFAQFRKHLGQEVESAYLGEMIYGCLRWRNAEVWLVSEIERPVQEGFQKFIGNILSGILEQGIGDTPHQIQPITASRWKHGAKTLWTEPFWLFTQYIFLLVLQEAAGYIPYRLQLFQI
jgi:hypothetical protein